MNELIRKTIPYGFKIDEVANAICTNIALIICAENTVISYKLSVSTVYTSLLYEIVLSTSRS